MTGKVIHFPLIYTDAARQPDDPPCEVIVLPVIRVWRECEPEPDKPVRGRKRSLLREPA